MSLAILCVPLDFHTDPPSALNALTKPCSAYTILPAPQIPHEQITLQELAEILTTSGARQALTRKSKAL